MNFTNIKPLVCHSATYLQWYDGHGLCMVPFLCGCQILATWLYAGKSIHALASLEQQHELIMYMNLLDEWLGHNVKDSQAELHVVSAHIDRLHEDLNRLGLTWGPCKLYHLFLSHIASIYFDLLIFSPAVRGWSKTWPFYSVSDSGCGISGMSAHLRTGVRSALGPGMEWTSVLECPLSHVVDIFLFLLFLLLFLSSCAWHPSSCDTGHNVATTWLLYAPFFIRFSTFIYVATFEVTNTRHSAHVYKMALLLVEGSLYYSI